MSESQRRLGKGLSSLIATPKASKLTSQLESAAMADHRAQAPASDVVGRPRAISIPLDDIAPNKRQPRRNISEQGVQRLAESVRRHGLIQPVVVRPMPQARASNGGDISQVSVKYELIAGERRWRAARAAGLSDDLFHYGRPIGLEAKLDAVRAVSLAAVEKYVKRIPRETICVATLGKKSL